MRKFMIFALALALISCTTTKAIDVEAPDDEAFFVNLIDEPQTAMDIFQNSLVFESLYYAYKDYSSLLMDFINHR